MDDDECGIDIFALIHSIRKFPVLWIERAHTTTVMRKIAWNQVAAQTGMEGKFLLYFSRANQISMNL